MPKTKPDQRQMMRITARRAGLFSRSTRAQAIGFQTTMLLLLVGCFAVMLNPPLAAIIFGFFLFTLFIPSK